MTVQCYFATCTGTQSTPNDRKPVQMPRSHACAVQALTWLLSVPGASKTVLEARIPYGGGKSMAEILAREPETYACTLTAVEMARAAYRQAAHLSEFGVPILGLSCTCALATDRVKKGDHKVSILQSGTGLAQSAVPLLAEGMRCLTPWPPAPRSGEAHVCRYRTDACHHRLVCPECLTCSCADLCGGAQRPLHTCRAPAPGKGANCPTRPTCLPSSHGGRKVHPH